MIAVANWLGVPGAYASSFLLRIFGVGALALVLPISVWGWRLTLGRRLNQTGWRIAAFILGLLFVDAGLGIV
ncbi:MAG: DNA translocase FtsK 4TM domain-containing protein, partial [Alphaproteobacteria bacterium]